MAILSKKILIIAKSRVLNNYAPTAYGYFRTIEEAEEVGKQRIKTLNWAIAYEVQNKNLENKIETSYSIIKAYNKEDEEETN